MLHLRGVFLAHAFGAGFAFLSPVGGAFGGFGKAGRSANGKAAGLDGLNTRVLHTGLMKLLIGVEHGRCDGGFRRPLCQTARPMDEACFLVGEVEPGLALPGGEVFHAGSLALGQFLDGFGRCRLLRLFSAKGAGLIAPTLFGFRFGGCLCIRSIVYFFQ